MGYIIAGIIIIAIIYGIIKLLIWLVPKLLIGAGIIFAVGGLVGLFVGVFYGIKNYTSSIRGNINNMALKITMLVITSVSVLVIMFYGIAIAYFMSAYN